MNHITKLKKVVNKWKMRNLSPLLKKITIFKTLTLWKNFHLALVTSVPRCNRSIKLNTKKISYEEKINLRLNMTPCVMVMKIE